MASVILTRSAAENERIAPFFERRGLTVYSAPMIELRALERDACGLRAVRRLAGGAPVLLSSAHAAELWLDLRETEFHEFPPERYYVVGRAAAELLREGDPDVPIAAVAGSAAELLPHDFTGVTRMLYPCSAGRRDTLVEGLRARGVDVVELPLYEPAMPASGASALAAALAAAGPSVGLAFFSPSAVENFFRVAGVPRDAVVAAIGPTTAEALSGHGVHAVLRPASPDADALAEVIATALLHRPGGGHAVNAS